MDWAVNRMEELLWLLFWIWPGVVLGLRFRRPVFPWWAIAVLAIAGGYVLLLAPVEWDKAWLSWQLDHASYPPPQVLIDRMVHDGGAVMLRAFPWLFVGLSWVPWLGVYGIVAAVRRENEK